MGETTLNAYLAATSARRCRWVRDDATCREGRALVPDVVTVKTKDATGRFSAKMIHPTRVREALREGAARAVELAPTQKPLVPKGSNEIELVFLTSAMADMAELIPATRAQRSRAVSYASRDYLEL